MKPEYCDQNHVPCTMCSKAPHEGEDCRGNPLGLFGTPVIDIGIVVCRICRRRVVDGFLCELCRYELNQSPKLEQYPDYQIGDKAERMGGIRNVRLSNN